FHQPKRLMNTSFFVQLYRTVEKMCGNTSLANNSGSTNESPDAQSIVDKIRNAESVASESFSSSGSVNNSGGPNQDPSSSGGPRPSMKADTEEMDITPIG
ncbi:hypothetical protein FHG87_015943, partial [Trinorchestia longiramus]